MSKTLAIFGAILFIGAFAIPDTTDEVVAESFNAPLELLEQGSGEEAGSGSGGCDIEAILASFDSSTAGSFNHEAIKEGEALLKCAGQIKDPAKREETIRSLEGLRLDIEQQQAAMKVSDHSVANEATEEDAKNPVSWATRTNSTELFQHVYDESNTDPEYVEIKHLHKKFKSLIQDHNVDTSQARIRSNEEHNDLVTSYIVDSFLSTDEEHASGTSFLQVGGDKTAGAKCLQGMLLAIAPKFCWKSGHHNHDADYSCPSGYHKWGAECFQNCRGGYYWVGGGTCWAHCRSGEEELVQVEAPKEDQDTEKFDSVENTDSLISTSEAETTGEKVGLWRRRRRRRRRSPYSDHGATCYKGIFDWYAKHHYWTHRLTKFDSRVTCRHTDQYKSGAMCYRDCAKIATDDRSLMENCGWDACATAGSTCASTIGNMVMEIGFAIASLAVLYFTAGAAAPATMAGRQLVKRSGATVAKTIAQAGGRSVLKRSNQVFFKTTWKNVAKKFTARELAMNGAENWGMNAVKAACNEYAKAYYNKLGGNTPFDPASLDPTGTANAVNNCKDADRYPWTCAGAITSAASSFDPTGLTGVASAFMHDGC